VIIGEDAWGEDEGFEEDKSLLNTPVEDIFAGLNC
jgi:hypothetical protein